MTKWSYALCGATLGLAVSGSSVGAQTLPGGGEDCKVDVSTVGCTGLGWHKAPSGASRALGDGAHTACQSCQYVNQQGDTVSGPFEYCHGDCDSGFEDEPELSASYLAVLQAARHGNVTRVLELAPRLARHVILNRSRESLQITSCANDYVIASLKLNLSRLSTQQLIVVDAILSSAVRRPAFSVD